MSGLNWQKARWRALIRDRGCEDARGDDQPMPTPRDRRRRQRPMTKAELRVQADAAVAAWQAKAKPA